ncbi:MAG: adenylosuccinate lyase, partial [Sinomicrobium sp.]|nr:adenylosuccinate lyase [Sinomicrobium sp.]
MSLSTLNALSPVDGRYRSKTEVLAGFFSEAALIRYRIRVEVLYFIALCRIPLPQLRDVDPSLFDALNALHRRFSTDDAEAVKAIEKITNHDVKAVEYFIKDAFDALGAAPYK